MSSHSFRNAQDLSISALLSPDSEAPDVIRAIVQKHLDRALRSLPSRNDLTDAGLLNHIGNTILHLQDMVTDVANELVDDNFLRQKTDGNLGHSHKGGNLSDLLTLRDMVHSTGPLSALKDSLNSNSGNTREAWNMATKPQELPPHYAVPPQLDVNFSPRSSFSRSNRTDSLSGARFGHRSAISDMSPFGVSPYGANPSPESMDSPASPVVKSEPPTYDVDMDLDPESLKNRGKSSYVCKYGKSCTKGGVDQDGNMIEFVRNCMIRQHIDKHEKPHKCDIAGCPNKEGFARKDQLERHKLNVKHEAPP